MSESDEYLSSVDLEDERSVAESTDSDEISDDYYYELEVFGLVEPYEGEPRAWSGDDLMTVMKLVKQTKTVSLPQHWDRDFNKKFS